MISHIQNIIKVKCTALHSKDLRSFSHESIVIIIGLTLGREMW